MSLKDYFNKLIEDPSVSEEDEEYIDTVGAKATPETRKEETRPMEKTENTRTEANGAYNRVTRTDGTASVLELKVVRPESYKAVGQIADHLLNRCTVVLNLEAAEKETARRIVDFLNGVAYSIDGQIKPVANNTFVITPKNVTISGEQLSDAQNAKGQSSSDEF